MRAARAVGSVAWLALTGAAGCAGAAPPPPRELERARTELLRVAERPLDEAAAEAWSEAEEALAQAELAGAHPAAEDAAYVALRMAERARLAALYAADRLALEHARGMVRRLGEDNERREAFFVDLARRRQADAEARARAVATRRSALEEIRAADPGSVLLERQEGLLFRIPPDALFLPGTSLLRSGGEPRLAALAMALLRPPACDVRVQVLDDIAGAGTDAGRLAERRSRTLHDALRAHGVPADAFLPPLRRPPSGTQVDVLAIERPPAAKPSPAR